MHFCPNPDCAYRAWAGWGNLRANGHPSGGPWRQLLCVVCRSYFFETLGTIFHGKRTSVELIVRVIACLAEGLGIRGTARVFEVDANTVLPWLVDAAEQLRAFLCFARKVCHFAMKGLPLGLQETASGVWERSTGRDERATYYHADAIIRPVISQKRAIAPKICRIARKVCREKSVWNPKIEKALRNFGTFQNRAKVVDSLPDSLWGMARCRHNLAPHAKRSSRLSFSADGTIRPLESPRGSERVLKRRESRGLLDLKASPVDLSPHHGESPSEAVVLKAPC